MQRIKIFILISIFNFSNISFGQTTHSKMKCDSVFSISYNDFEKIATESLKLLENKNLGSIKISEHQIMIRVYNTILTHQKNDKKLNSKKIKSLERIMSDREYIKKMLKVFPKWVPNRGMGIYFNALNIELGGAPCSWSRYFIK